MLTQEELKNHLDYSIVSGKFYWKNLSRNKNVVAGSLNFKGYVKIGISGKVYSAHRLAWLFVYGTWPKNQIDHINKNKACTAIHNLREVTNQENQWNNSAKGYSKNGNTYTARIRVNGDYLYLGSYNTPDLARSAYLLAKEKYHVIT